MTAALWTPEQVEQLNQLVGTKSYAEIAEIIGKTKDAVKHKLYSLQGKRKPKAKKEVKKQEPREPMLALYKNHDPKKYVAQEVVSKLVWCKTCHSPVSNWTEHSERRGCKRNA